MARLKTPAQIAAAKRNLAIARSKRRRGRVTKARVAKRQFHAKNRRKIARKRGVVEYKRTGLLVPTPSRTWHGMVRKSKRASRHNVKYGKQLKKHNARINKAIAKAKY